MHAEAHNNEERDRRDAPQIRGRVLATLNPADFKKAQTILTEFRTWSDFDDFCMERDGELIASACAGLEVEMVSVSLSAFEAWRAHSHAAATLGNLDLFAELMAAYRKTPWAAIAASGAIPAVYPATTLIVTVDVSRYRDWARAFEGSGVFPEAPSVDDFARLLLECWADGVPPTPSACSDAAPV